MPIADNVDSHESFYVYVITAIRDGRVCAQEVTADAARADCVFRAWKFTYGGYNVCLASREVHP